MAKKNSTKTATKEALQASEPKIQNFKQWSGMNIKEASPSWTPESEQDQTDLAMNYFLVQNNADMTLPQKGVATRADAEIIASVPEDGIEFEGVTCLWGDILYCVFSDNTLRYHKLGNPPDLWAKVRLVDPDGDHGRITNVEHFQSTLIVFTANSEIFTGYRKSVNGYVVDEVSSAAFIDTPTDACSVECMGGLSEGDVTRIAVQYTYTNRFGQTLPSPVKTIYVDASPVEWSSARYLKISGVAPTGKGITGIDIYYALDDNSDAVFGGHVTLSDGGSWSYNWLGAMADTSIWTSVPLTVPTENTTKGVHAQYCADHDGRLYFWGDSDNPSRLYIGGNAGSELSVSRGLGGAFIDIDPDGDMVVHGTAKFKTYNGASIVTVMCGNPNTGDVKRFNLLETSITLTNEITSKGYMSEEVSNVIGCNSRWGYGVFADGLYSVSRYGLAVTTQVMESNNQLKAQYVSDPVKPIFTESMGNQLTNCRMVFIDGVIYIVLGMEDGGDDSLDEVVLCYDVDGKAWWTYTVPEIDGGLLHAFSIDSQDHWEGLGLIARKHVAMIPTTGDGGMSAPRFPVLLETGELTTRQPISATHYLCQLELRFDFFCGDATITVQGIDYYGRSFKAVKNVHEDAVLDFPVWIRVDKLVETYNVRIEGKARFRMTHILAKVYQQSSKVNLVYGFDDRVSYRSRRGKEVHDHHCLKSYNNLRDAIVT